MKLASTVIWILLYATWGIFALWAIAGNLHHFEDGLTVIEAAGLFCLVWCIFYPMKKIGDLQDEVQESKKDKG